MRHLDEGQLRAHYDGALSGTRRARVEAHLRRCARCAARGAVVQARGERVRSVLMGTDPQPSREAASTHVAWQRFERYSGLKKERENAMLKNVFARRYRPAWGLLGVVLALAIAFSFAPVRAWAGNLLELFRVQKIEFVEVDPEQLSDEAAFQSAVRKLEGVLEEEAQVEFDGSLQSVNIEEARALAEFQVRFPRAVEGEPSIMLRPGMHASMQVDLPRVRSLLAELGYQDVELPDSLHGAEVSIDVQTSVMASYGVCGEEGGTSEEQAEACTVLVQMPAPDVSAPADLDIDRLGQAYLQLLGMSAEEAEAFGKQVNWTTTLVVPIPRSTNLSHSEVNVDGVSGTVVRPPSYSANRDEYLLIWVRGGIVYALSGSGTTEQALRIGNSLQ